jgi:hypothetical protein
MAGRLGMMPLFPGSWYEKKLLSLDTVIECEKFKNERKCVECVKRLSSDLVEIGGETVAELS